MLVINSPANPTGGVLTRGDLEAIAELAIRHDLVVLADEIYGRILYDGDGARLDRVAARAWPSGRSSSTASPRPSR